MPSEPKTLTVRLLDQSDFTHALKSALSEEVLRVRLESPPDPKLLYELEILGESDRVVVLAEVAGPMDEGRFPLRLRPRTQAQFSQLFTLIAKIEKEQIAFDETLTPAIQNTLGKAGGTLVLPMPQIIEARPPRAQMESLVEVSEVDPHWQQGKLAELEIDDATLERQVPKEKTIAPDPLLGRKLGDKFEIESLVGAGGSGAVYKSRHIGLRRAVAIKVLHPHYQADPEFMKRFHREALAASRLDHINIMRVLDFGQEPDGLVYIVMEFLSGASLQSVLYNERRLAPERAISIMIQVASALSAAHEQGIIHRDVKPDNIVLVPGKDDEGSVIEVVKVCDFGIAALQNTHPDDDGSRATDPNALALSIGGGYLCGTPEYMAPEQARGGVADARSDVYACGCTLYELLTGLTPFANMSPMETIAAQTANAPAPLSRSVAGLSPKLETLVLKTLAKAPEERQQTTRQFRNELREALEAEQKKNEVSLDEPQRTKRHASEPSVDIEASLSAFIVFIASAVTGAGAFRPENAATFRQQMRDGIGLFMTLTEKRRELTFVRRDTEKSIGFFVLLGDGEAIDLKKLLGKETYERLGKTLVTELARPGIAALTLSREVTEAALSDLTTALRDKREDTAQWIASGRWSGISALFPNEIVGRDRKLAWKVGLSASRLARDLALLQRSNTALVRAQEHAAELIARTVRVLTKADEIRQILIHLDIVAARGARIDGLAAQFVNALPVARCGDVVVLLLADCDQKEGLERDRAASLAQLFARRLVRERSPEQFGLLCDLGVRGMIAVNELPEDAALLIRAEQLAEKLARGADQYLAHIAEIVEIPMLQQELTVLKGSLKILARRGEALALLSAVSALARIVASKGQNPGVRERLALKVITSVAADERLVPTANAFLLGQPHLRQAAKDLLVMMGEAGAVALVRARQLLREPMARPRFVAVMKETGAHGSAAIAKALSQVDPVRDGLDLSFAEDLLRGVPVRPDSSLANEIARLMRHRSLRAPALFAFAEVSGDHAKDRVMEALEHADESLRASALAALAHLNAVDDAVVASIERLLSRPGAGEPVRRAAVSALRHATGAGRARALGLLSRLVEGKAGLLSMLRSGEQIEEPLLIVDAARSLLVLERNEGIRAVMQRRSRASADLAAKLDALVEETSGRRRPSP